LKSWGHAAKQRIKWERKMDPAAEFRRHADECRRMALSTANPEDRASWNQLAARWLACATQFEKQTKAAQTTSRAARRGIGPSQRAA
jgi:hypothetical protein